MKALVVSPQPFFSPRGTPLSIYYRTLVMAELGVDIDLLTYGEGVDVDIPGVRVVRIPRFGFLGQVRIGPSALKLFLDLLMALWTIDLLLRRRYDFVHAHEEAVFFCRFLKPLFRFKLVYDMHSSLPQQLINFQFTKSRFLIGLFDILERSCLQATDAIITICPDLSHYVSGLIRDGKKHFLIENSIFDPVRLLCPSGDSNPFPREASEENPAELARDRRYVVYAGTLEPYQGIDLLIGAFSRIVASHPEAFLIIVGGTQAQVTRYTALAQRFKLGRNCLFTGRVPPDEARRYVRLASVLVSPRSTGTNTPLKVYEQLASGIPLVATRIHSHTQVLNDEVAILVEPRPEDMARGILLALEANGGGQQIARNARRLYEQKYSRRVYVRKMQQLLEFLSPCAA